MATEWRFRANGVELGPVSTAQLRTLALGTMLSPDDDVQNGADGEWVRAAKVQGLFEKPTCPHEAPANATERDLAPNRIESPTHGAPASLDSEADLRENPPDVPLDRSIALAIFLAFGVGLPAVVVWFLWPGIVGIPIFGFFVVCCLVGWFGALSVGVFKILSGAFEREEKAKVEQDSKLICPHCQTAGKVRTARVQVKAGISGGKATAALLTGGVSMLATGLSRKEGATAAYCSNCGSRWRF